MHASNTWVTTVTHVDITSKSHEYYNNSCNMNACTVIPVNLSHTITYMPAVFMPDR